MSRITAIQVRAAAHRAAQDMGFKWGDLHSGSSTYGNTWSVTWHNAPTYAQAWSDEYIDTTITESLGVFTAREAYLVLEAMGKGARRYQDNHPA